MKKQLIAVLLVFVIIFSLHACTKTDGSFSGHTQEIMQMDQTDTTSIISGVRTGLCRSSIVWGDNQFECTDDGVYYMTHNIPYTSEQYGSTLNLYGSFIFFCEHGSDQMIKLCGRPDCSHTTNACNAFFQNAVGGVSYFNGYLYVVTAPASSSCVFELYRIDLDGSNRVKVGEFGKWLGGGGGYSFVSVINGVFSYNLAQIDKETGTSVYTRYYYKLDGSMKEAQVANNLPSIIREESIALLGKDDNGNTGEYVYSIDMQNDTKTFLFDKTDYGYGGYWGTKAGYYLDGTSIMKVEYAEEKKTVLFETGLDGTYSARFFPDCIILIELSNGNGSTSRPRLIFYNWEGKVLGEMYVDFPYDQMPSVEAIIGGETKDRILISTSSDASNTLPEFYIEKSDFGSGNIQLHRFKYPDLDEDTLNALFTCWEPIQ